MAITNPQPPQIDGKTFPLLGFSLAMSTTPVSGTMQLNIAVTFVPYREQDGIVEVLQEGRIALTFGDAMTRAQADPALAQFLGGLETLAQNYVNRTV